jgi:hypothetical protein
MKKVFYIFLFSVIASTAVAQNSLVSWQYSIGFGTGDLHDYISSASFRGVTFNYQRFVRPDLSTGLEFGWNVFYQEKPFGTYTRGDFDYSGKQYRYSNNFPMLATINYYLRRDEAINPFAGLGIGTMYSIKYMDMGSYGFTSDAWPFVLKPELGIIYKTDGASISLSSKYYYGFKTSDLPAQSYITINLGLVLNY